MNKQTRVVIIDDHPLFRDGVVQTLGAHSDFEVVGQGSSAADAMLLCRELLPDLLLLDISIPGGGLNAAKEIANDSPGTNIVMLTASDTEEDLLDAFKTGARSYILKGVSARELIDILKVVRAGEAYVTPSLAASLLSELSDFKIGSQTVANLLAQLTEREHQILDLVAKGHTNKEVAAALFLSEKTIKNHMTNILQKLQVRNRVEAVLLARGEAQGTAE
jgi:two-component system nitrate/nitrite response regulator NarL